MDSEHMSRARSTTDSGVHAEVFVDGLWEAGHQKRNHDWDLETIGWLNATTIEVSCEEEPADWPTEDFEEMCGDITGNKLCENRYRKQRAKSLRSSTVGRTRKRRPFGTVLVHVHNGGGHRVADEQDDDGEHEAQAHVHYTFPHLPVDDSSYSYRQSERHLTCVDCC